MITQFKDVVKLTKTSMERKVETLDERDPFLHDDSPDDTDAGTGENLSGSDEVTGPDGDTGDTDIPDIIEDDTDGAPDPDAGDGDDAGTETGDALGDSGTSSGEENGEGSEEETDTEADSEDEDTAETDISETLLFDTEVLTEIRDTLSIHTDSMDGFVSSLTISGNSLTVSLDDGDAALLAETISNQTEILDGLDSLGIMLSLVFLVLIYDLLQRSAKRFVKNLTGGEKNGTNT
jgi:hypothetical protein